MAELKSTLQQYSDYYLCLIIVIFEQFNFFIIDENSDHPSP